jgi:predicted nucleic acid-binding protein
MSRWVLADTSLWIDFLRRGQDQLRAAAEARRLILCGPVAAEVLRGVREQDRETMRLRLMDLPWAPLGVFEWLEAGDVSAALLRRGTPVALPDVAIAVAARAFGARLVTGDRDFLHVAEVMPELDVEVLAERS